MKKWLPVIVAVILTMAASVWYGFTDKTQLMYDNNVNTAVYTALGIPAEGQYLEQTFVCKEDKLNGFKLKSNPSGNPENTVVKLELLDAETGKIISKGEESGAKIKPRKLHYYKIDPVEGVKGKSLILRVSEENTTAEDGIALYYQPKEVEEGSLLFNGTSLQGVTIARTVTERFDLETCLVMLFAEWFIWGFMWFLYRLFK